MASPSDRPAPRFGPRVRTYEQQITAEFEHEIAELYGKLYERDMEIERLRADKDRLDWLEKWLPKQPGHRRLVFDRSVPEFTLFQSDDNVRRLGMEKTLRAAIDRARAASRDEERDHG